MSQAVKKERPLNPRQIRFCQEYVVDLNVTQAYIRAGYEVNSSESASAAGSKLLTDIRVKALVERLQKDKARRLEIDSDRVLAELSRLAFSNIKGIFDGSDGLLRVVDLDDDMAAAVQSVKVTKKPSGEQDENGNQQYEDVVEYKLADKKSALDLLGKHLELFVDRSKMDLNVTDETSMLEKMRKARERVSDGVDTQPAETGPELADPLNEQDGQLPD